MSQKVTFCNVSNDSLLHQMYWFYIIFIIAAPDWSVIVKYGIDMCIVNHLQNMSREEIMEEIDHPSELHHLARQDSNVMFEGELLIIIDAQKFCVFNSFDDVISSIVFNKNQR